MENPKVFATEFGMKGALSGGKSYSVVGAEFSELNSNDLLFAANIDAMAFICLYHMGLLQNSTYCWLPIHAIEKYLKAYLLRCEGYTEKMLKNEFRHGINKPWELYKKEFGFNEHPVLEEYILELSEIKPDVRYGNACVIFNDNLLSGLVFFVVHFNKFKKHSSHYPNTYYGFEDLEFPNFNFLSRDFLRGIVKTYLHLIIEHNITVSSTGVSHPHKYDEVNFLKQNRKETNCPFCNGSAVLDTNFNGMTNAAACESVKQYFEINSKQSNV